MWLLHIIHVKLYKTQLHHNEKSMRMYSLLLSCIAYEHAAHDEYVSEASGIDRTETHAPKN